MVVRKQKLKQVKVYFSEADHEKMQIEAIEKNISLAELIRQKINLQIENVPAPRKAKKVYRTIDPKLLFEVNKIGVNLNQVARQLNSKKDDIPNSIVIEILFKIEQKLKELL